MSINFLLQISVSDIDFFGMTTEELELMESAGAYPPRFRVPILSSVGIEYATLHLARIKFKGAVNDLVFDIALIPTSSTTTSK